MPSKLCFFLPQEFSVELESTVRYAQCVQYQNIVPTDESPRQGDVIATSEQARKRNDKTKVTLGSWGIPPGTSAVDPSNDVARGTDLIGIVFLLEKIRKTKKKEEKQNKTKKRK